MKKFIPLFLILLQATLFAEGGGISSDKAIVAYKINNTKVKIDGNLVEPVWQQIPVKEFTQRDPNEGKPASEETNVWIAYDEDNIYVAARLKDSNPHLIDASLGRRDAYIDSDWFGFYVDPYNDKRTGYFFAVNAGGTIVDGTLFNDGWDDATWDGIWEVKTSIDDSGWSVEMRIPFSQLRFNENEEMTWGVNFAREIKRFNERSFYIMVPKNESGFVSRFAPLQGLSGIKPEQRLEILPYAVQKAQYLKHDSNDPFYKSNQYKTSLGADLKIGVGSNLNIDATFNPDFGQVEVDPAVINLTAFESYFQEKRPFFIEGANTFMFGIGGANNNMGLNFNWPQLFYSRRIGRAPQGRTSSAQFVDFPTETRIIGAAKLTGKINESTAIGAVSAVTERTFATLFNNGIKTQEQVEPLTHYGVLRAKKEFNDRNQSLGFMLTSVSRNLNYEPLKSRLAQNALAFGLDGWTFLDSNQDYIITGAFAGSYIKGTKEFIQRLQKQPYRYFQRPDATYATYDPERTSLSGWYGRVMLNKQKGDLFLNAAIGAASPGFEYNDLGFQWLADRINAHFVLGYKWFEPSGIFRRKMIYAAAARSYDFEGNLNSSFIWLRSNLTFMNYWGIGLQGAYSFESLNKTSTRGGPLVLNPAGYSIYLSFNSDSRERIYFDFEFEYKKNELGGKGSSLAANVNWLPSPQLNFSIGPRYDLNLDTRQWVGNFTDATALHTYGIRYVFSDIEQKTISANIRLNWSFSPALSLQLFLQPFFAVGNYSNFKELARPRSLDLNTYGKNNSTISLDKQENIYKIDPDGNGPATSFSLSNPDFNYKSLRGNLVLRWEALPGSIFYFVWSHDQTNYQDAGSFELARDFKNLWKSDGNDVFLIKFSYWLDI